MDDIQKMEELERICLRTIRDYSWDTVYFKDINSNYIWNSKKHAEQFGADPDHGQHECRRPGGRSRACR